MVLTDDRRRGEQEASLNAELLAKRKQLLNKINGNIRRSQNDTNTDTDEVNAPKRRKLCEVDDNEQRCRWALE